MALTQSGVTELANMIPEVWSPILYNELRSNVMFANFFSRQYEGEIRNVGDMVRVNTLHAPTGEIITNDKAQFSAEAINVTQKTITANKRASAAFIVTDLAQLQSMQFQSEMQTALVFAIRKQLEADLLSALIPSAAAPDHDIAPAVAGQLAAVDVTTCRTLLSEALVPVEGRALFLSPSYYSDLLNETKPMSRDFVNGNSAASGVVDVYGGFMIAEHNLLTGDLGYAVHPSALQLVMQQDLRVKISDRHSAGYYDYVVSADFVYGYSLFDNKRIIKISA